MKNFLSHLRMFGIAQEQHGEQDRHRRRAGDKDPGEYGIDIVEIAPRNGAQHHGHRGQEAHPRPSGPPGGWRKHHRAPANGGHHATSHRARDRVCHEGHTRRGKEGVGNGDGDANQKHLGEIRGEHKQRHRHHGNYE